MDTLTLQGRRWGSIGIFVLTAPLAALTLWAALMTVFIREIWETSVLVVLGVFMLLTAMDALLKAVRPNQLRLTQTGLTLDSVYQAKTWSWDQYAGLHGWWYRVLIVREKPSKTRWIAIGHWQPDLGRAIADYARRAGCEVPPGSEAVITLSPVPLFITSGLLATIALAVALH